MKTNSSHYVGEFVELNEFPSLPPLLLYASFLVSKEKQSQTTTTYLKHLSCSTTQTKKKSYKIPSQQLRDKVVNIATKKQNKPTHTVDLVKSKKREDLIYHYNQKHQHYQQQSQNNLGGNRSQTPKKNRKRQKQNLRTTTVVPITTETTTTTTAATSKSLTSNSNITVFSGTNITRIVAMTTTSVQISLPKREVGNSLRQVTNNSTSQRLSNTNHHVSNLATKSKLAESFLRLFDWSASLPTNQLRMPLIQLIFFKNFERDSIQLSVILPQVLPVTNTKPDGNSHPQKSLEPLKEHNQTSSSDGSNSSESDELSDASSSSSSNEENQSSPSEEEISSILVNKKEPFSDGSGRIITVVSPLDFVDNTFSILCGKYTAKKHNNSDGQSSDDGEPPSKQRRPSNDDQSEDKSSSCNGSSNNSGSSDEPSDRSNQGSGNGSNSDDEKQQQQQQQQRRQLTRIMNNKYASIEIIDGTRNVKYGTVYWVQRNVVTIKILVSFIFDECRVLCSKEDTNDVKLMEVLKFVDHFSKQKSTTRQDVSADSLYEVQIKKRIPFTSGRPETQKHIWLTAEFYLKNTMIHRVNTKKFYVCSRPGGKPGAPEPEKSRETSSNSDQFSRTKVPQFRVYNPSQSSSSSPLIQQTNSPSASTDHPAASNSEKESQQMTQHTDSFIRSNIVSIQNQPQRPQPSSHERNEYLLTQEQSPGKQEEIKIRGWHKQFDDMRREEALFRRQSAPEDQLQFIHPDSTSNIVSGASPPRTRGTKSPPIGGIISYGPISIATGPSTEPVQQSTSGAKPAVSQQQKRPISENGIHVSGMHPLIGPCSGGQLVTLTGDFSALLFPRGSLQFCILFGLLPAKDITVRSDSILTFLTPPRLIAGKVDVVFTMNGRELPRGFRYTYVSDNNYSNNNGAGFPITNIGTNLNENTYHDNSGKENQKDNSLQLQMNMNSEDGNNDNNNNNNNSNNNNNNNTNNSSSSSNNNNSINSPNGSIHLPSIQRLFSDNI